jgi:hypothetical protein
MAGGGGLGEAIEIFRGRCKRKGCDFIGARIYVNVRFYVHLVCEKRAALCDR